jgi:hypothetical protein
VVQSGRDPALPHGALPSLLGLHRVEARFQPELLDSDRTQESLVVGLPHDAHRAAADPPVQAVTATDEASFFRGHPRAPNEVMSRAGMCPPTTGHPSRSRDRYPVESRDTEYGVNPLCPG